MGSFLDGGVCGSGGELKLTFRFIYLFLFLFFFYVLLTVHLIIFISVMNQLDAQNFCFTVSLFYASTCFEHMCSKHVEA